MTDSTAVTTRSDKLAALSPQQEAIIEARKAQNLMASEIAKLSWGQSMSQNTARAVAEWGRVNNVDVLTEIFILGGRLYLNGAFYIRKLSELIADGHVEYARFEHVNEDKRLEAFPEERKRRLAVRVQYNIPDSAKGACLCHVKLKSMTEEVVGVEACGGPDLGKDPVGDADPTKTAETRSARRAVRLLASHLPRLAHEVETVEAAFETIEPAIEADVKSIEPPRAFTPVATADDPYAVEQGDAFEDPDHA